MPTVLLVRHAQASFGAADYDALSPHGIAQSEALAAALRARGLTVDRVVSGGLVRQRDTAARLRPGPGAGAPELEIDPRWDEYDANAILAAHAAEPVGGLDGTTLEPRRFQELLDAALADWIAAGADGPAPETWTAFRARVDGALRELCAELGRGETAVVCTSGGALAAACGGLLGAAETLFVGLQRVVVNTGVTKVVHGRAGSTLLSFNDHGHLERPGGTLVTYR